MMVLGVAAVLTAATAAVSVAASQSVAVFQPAWPTIQTRLRTTRTRTSGNNAGFASTSATWYKELNDGVAGTGGCDDSMDDDDLCMTRNSVGATLASEYASADNTNNWGNCLKAEGLLSVEQSNRQHDKDAGEHGNNRRSSRLILLQNGKKHIHSLTYRAQTVLHRLFHKFGANLGRRNDPHLSDDVPLSRQRRSRTKLRQRVVAAAMAILLVASSWTTSAAWAGVSGGRLGGGSFKSRSTSSSAAPRSRPMMGGRTTPNNMRSPSRYYHGSSRWHHSTPVVPLLRMNSYHMHMTQPSPLLRATATPVIGDVMVARCRATPIRDTIVLYGTGALLVYGFRQSLKNGTSSSGSVRGSTSNRTTVGSLTVALFVRKDDPDNILARLSRLAERADTASSKGLQDLLSQVALELLRQEPAITAARAQWRPYDSLLRAEQAFQLLSVEGRSKVDRLTVNKFGSQNRPDARKVLSRNDNDDDESLRFSSSTTMAVVTLNFAMMKQEEEEDGSGDYAQGLPNNISTRSDLRRALRQISADAVVSDDRLLSAEILWLPEDSSETLSRDDVYADYPDLVPI